MGKKISRLLKIREAAQILNVNPETLRRWDKKGRLKAIRVGTKRDRRYRKEDIEKYIQI